MTFAQIMIDNSELMEKVRNKYSVVTCGHLEGRRADVAMILLDMLSDKVSSSNLRELTYALHIAMRMSSTIEPTDWWLENMDAVAADIIVEARAVSPALEFNASGPSELDTMVDIVNAVSDNLVQKWAEAV